MPLKRLCWTLALTLLLMGCGVPPEAGIGALTDSPSPVPASPDASMASSGAAPSASPSAIPHGPGVAELLRRAPAPGTAIEVDAYFSGTTPMFHRGPLPDPKQVHCPDFQHAALTDRPLPAGLSVLNASHGNALPDEVPWLIAAVPEATHPGVTSEPQLPYHARLRGHLGDPAFAHCPRAGRIFIIEQVVRVYAHQPPDPAGTVRKLPDDYASWPRHHDAALGYSLPHPPDWMIEALQEPEVLGVLTLRSPRWPDYPVMVRIHPGETHLDPYNPQSTSSYTPAAPSVTSFPAGRPTTVPTPAEAGGGKHWSTYTYPDRAWGYALPIPTRDAAKACEQRAVGADGTLPQRRDLDPLHVQWQLSANQDNGGMQWPKPSFDVGGS